MASTSIAPNLSSEEEETLLDNMHKKGKRKQHTIDDHDAGQSASKSLHLDTSGTGSEPSSFANFSEKSVRIMQQMGYKAGTGLGKAGQGRVDLIETSSQKGRSGLGMLFC
uniref:G-patch domain-containing protein n=1 Tax=Anopheles maculatus TaxID=74869 RepID=A0A182SCI5_9DIPT